MCKGPGKDWQRCLSCTQPDCTWDGVTNWEKQQAARVDDLAFRELGLRSERSLKRAARYQARKDAARDYYQRNRDAARDYYQQNKEKLKKRSLERYYTKVRSSLD